MNESQLIEQKKNRSLETIITSHDNNFNLVRLIAAIFVVIYHSYELNTRSPFMTDPLTSILSPYSNTGDVGVGTFFIISGIFVTQSWLRDANLVRFSAKRFARIVPGLFVCLLLTTVTAVIFCSEKGWRGLFTQAPWQYIFENTLIHRLKDIIPPVENQVPGIYYNLNNTFMNGSLWTLYWEVRMYVLLALIGVSSIIPARQWFASVAIFCLIAAAVHPELITPYMWEFKLFTLFMAGVLIQCCAAKIYIQVRHVVCAFAYLFLMYKAPTFFGVALCFGALSLWVGSSAIPSFFTRPRTFD
jgi:peptidoglycan/LPS O-acetylase OafA/YrhL